MAYKFINTSGNGTDYIQGTATLFSYPFSINLWFYPPASALGTVQAFVLHNTTDVHRFALQINTATTRIAFNAFTTANALATVSVNYTANAWNMATVVATSATSRTIYINNGGAVTNTTSRVLTTPTRWLIGANYGGAITPNLEAQVAEVAVWNATISTTDIASLYTGAKATAVKPQNLKIYVPLIRDISENAGSTTSITSTISDTTIEPHVRRYG